MLMMYLAQNVTSGASGSGDIVTIVYVLTSISFIIGFIVGTYKYVQRQKKKWTEEGVTRQKQNQAMAENTAQMVKNTDAIERLTSKFGEFAVSVRHELDGMGDKLNGMGDRIGVLEKWRHNQNSRE
jgi:uncharacterized protein HemX